MNSHKIQDKIPGISDQNQNQNLIIQSDSNELIGDFNTKMKEITTAMHELHFSTIQK